MTAHAYEPFAQDLDRAAGCDEWLIEHVPTDRDLGRRIEGWKLLVGRGWNITVLVANDNSHVVAIGCR